MGKRRSVTVEITLEDGQIKKSTKFSVNEITKDERIVTVNVQTTSQEKTNVKPRVRVLGSEAVKSVIIENATTNTENIPEHFKTGVN